MTEQRGFRALGILLLLGVIILVSVGLGLLRVGPAPDILIRPAAPAIGKRTPVTVEVSEPNRGVSCVKVELVQGDHIESLAEKSYEYPWLFGFRGSKTAHDTLSLQVGREKNPALKAGQASIRVTAGRIGTWLRHPGPVTQEVSLPVRLTPPLLQVISTQTYVSQGGSEVVVYRVGDTAVRDGVRAGKWWFPGYPLPGGGKNEHFAFFAIPYDMTAPDARLVASDAASNEAEVSFIDKFTPKNFKEDSVELTDAFIGKVVPEIMSQTPDLRDRGNPLDNYLAINNVLREQDAQALLALVAQSQKEILWSKPFQSVRNGKVMAGFADYRTYKYQGRIVDHQTHLGYDLAITRHYPVPATNDGIVVQAKFFGIYGNCVIIDHGCGVMSLYGHLSSMAVTPGQKVAQGDIIGQTGETGLAGGDHLHFAIIMDGLPVNPLEWWDGHWLRDRIARKLGAGFHFAE